MANVNRAGRGCKVVLTNGFDAIGFCLLVYGPAYTIEQHQHHGSTYKPVTTEKRSDKITVKISDLSSLLNIFMSGKLGAVAAMPGDGRASPLPMARVQDRRNGSNYECVVLMQDPNIHGHV